VGAAYSNIDPIGYIRYNLLSRKVQGAGRGRLLPYRGCAIELRGDALVELTGSLRLGADSLRGAPCGNLLRVDPGGRLRVRDGFSVYYRGDIIVFKNGILDIGSGFANANLRIRCTCSIKIGRDVAISHDVTMMDSDAHELRPSSSPMTQPITIGDHVWIGSRAMILKGVTVGDGAVIGAGSIVTRDVSANSVVAGNPARIIRQGVSWR